MRLNCPANCTDTSSVDTFSAQASSEGRDSSDSGGIVISWLIKVAATLALILVVLYDGISITYNNVATGEDARSVARAASDARLIGRATKRQAIAAAKEKAHATGVTLNPSDIVFESDGSIQVTVSRSVDTLAVKRIGPLEQFATAVEVYKTPAVR